MPRSPRVSLPVALATALALLLHPVSLLAETPGASALKQIRAVRDGGGTVVEMWADGAISGYRHFNLADPPRLVVDFPGLRSDLPSHTIPVANGQVERVRVGDHEDKVRVVIEVDPALIAGARLVRSDRGIALVLGDAEVPDASRSLATATPVPKRAAPRRTRPATPSVDASAQLSRAAEDLAAAARELSAAVRDLKGAGLARTSPTAPASAPATISTPSADASEPVRATRKAARELEVAARKVETATRGSATAPEAATAVAATAALAKATPAVSAPGPRVPVSPPTATTAYPQTYAGVMQWIRENQAMTPRFASGDAIPRRDLSKLRPFVPPGYYEEMDFDGAAYEIQATTSHAAHESYQQATLQYQGQTTLSADGTVQNYVAGLPFSAARFGTSPARETGLMIAWNNIFRWQHSGYKAGPIPLAYITPGNNVPVEHADALSGGGNVERVIVMDYQRVYLAHQAALADQNYTVAVSDAESQHFKDWMQFHEPFDMRGMAIVFERFLDAHEPDQVNSYMPMERKVRRLSAKERADSFLGSEMTMDDFEGFSGRVLDYEWEFLGEKEVIHVANTKHPHPVFFGPMSHVPNDRWQVRDCYVVESRPLLPNHPYPRKLTFYDKETFNVPFTLAFDAEDRLLKVIYTIYRWPGGQPSDDPSSTVSLYQSSVVINKQSGRSMVNWSEKTEIPEMKASAIRRLFNVSTLTGGR